MWAEMVRRQGRDGESLGGIAAAVDVAALLASPLLVPLLKPTTNQ